MRLLDSETPKTAGQIVKLAKFSEDKETADSKPRGPLSNILSPSLTILSFNSKSSSSWILSSLQDVKGCWNIFNNKRNCDLFES